MAATVVLSESNGAGEVVTSNVSNINYGSSDTPNLNPASFPIALGAPGRSFLKQERIEVTAMGGSASVSNLRIWKSSGAYVTGEEIFTNVVAAYGGQTFAYQAPTQGSSNAAVMPMPIANPGVARLPTALPAVFGLIIVPGFSTYWGSQLYNNQGGVSTAGGVNQKIFTIQYTES